MFLGRFLYRNLKGYRFFIVIAITMTFLQVASDIIVALPLKYIPDKLQNHMNPPAYLNGLISYFDRFDTSEQARHLAAGDHTALGVILFSALILVVFALVSAALAYTQLFLAAFIAQNLTARLRKTLFEQIQRLSLDWHGKQKKGDIVQRVTGNIADIEKFVTDGLVDLLSGILTIVGVATVMLFNNVPYTLLSIVIVPALAVVVFSYTTSIKAAAKKTSKAAAEVADVAVEDFGAITVIKAFDLVDREAERFNKYVDKNRKAGLRAGGLQAQFTPLVTILVALGTAVIIGVGSYVAAGNTFSLLFITISASTIGIGTVVFFITLLAKLFQPMKDLSKLTNIATGAAAGAERIQEVLNQLPEVSESNIPYVGPQKLKGDIVFENVLFGYTPEKLILKGLNLHIPAGRKVALVGLSGGGKTTLVKLIPRFYEATQGSVKIDGRDNRGYPLSMLRQNISMVLQESVLFEGTILENLKIARPNASMNEVTQATKQAQIHDTIMSLPDGYGTMVRNQGKNFSGGQRQRLAIARALLSDASILVLDEPTASLDVEAELEVMRALEQLVVGRTVLMISHRLSTLGKVDEIIVLKDGQIAEQGTYKELKQKNGVFAELLRKQKSYDVDYAGSSVIIPQAELMKAVKQAQQGSQRPVSAPVVPPSPEVELVPPIPVPHHNGNQPLRKARILIEIEGKMVSEHQLDKPIINIGRLARNDIQIPSERVSRFHAKICWENGAWVIHDEQSLNGLIYQGSQVEQQVLTNGDRIYLAPPVILQYQEESKPLARAHPSEPKAQILIEIDGKVVGKHPLDKTELSIGSQTGNDVLVASPYISRKHAKILRENNTWVIKNEQSRNGLRYQGAQIDQHTFSNGDSIYLAPSVALKYEVIA